MLNLIWIQRGQTLKCLKIVWEKEFDVLWKLKINLNSMYLINLIGWSGSGKGYLAEKIIQMLGADKVDTIPMDMYYYPHDRFPESLHVEFEGNKFKNFDTPEALEIPSS